MNADFCLETNSTKKVERKRTPVPLLAMPVFAGFPSPADSHIESFLDLNEHCIHNPVTTYFVRIKGLEWGNLGVHQGDELIIDRSLPPLHGSMIIADIDGTRSLFRVEINDGIVELVDGHQHRYGPNSQFEPWGVVTYIIRKV